MIVNIAEEENVDLLTSVVGRKMLVTSAWFGPDFEHENKGLLFHLDIKEVLPATRGRGGMRRRLLISHEEREFFFVDRQSFATAIAPYLVPLSPLQTPTLLHSGDFFQKSPEFRKLMSRVQFDLDDELYLLRGTYCCIPHLTVYRLLSGRWVLVHRT